MMLTLLMGVYIASSSKVGIGQKQTRRRKKHIYMFDTQEVKLTMNCFRFSNLHNKENIEEKEIEGRRIQFTHIHTYK